VVHRKAPKLKNVISATTDQRRAKARDGGGWRNSAEESRRIKDKMKGACGQPTIKLEGHFKKKGCELPDGYNAKICKTCMS
jgi:hypothetical protein